MAQQVATQTADPSPKAPNRYPLLSPRFWHGMRAGDYFRLLRKNRYRIPPSGWPMAAAVTFFSCLNATLAALQQRSYGQRIADTRIEHPPLFIVGHWRSGTTYLHRLLTCDDRQAYCTSYECVAASHFLLTGRSLAKVAGWFLPKKRPMDEMSIRFDNPLEDEFALVALGAPTPYYRMAFPNNPAPYLEFLDMEDVEPADLERFREAMHWFFQAMTLAKGKRLLLKSPPHTGRVGVLAEMFPGARFIHITRHPYDLYPSTRRTWEALDFAQGFQRPHHRHLDDFIFEAHQRMYRGFHKQRQRLEPSQIYDIRYEELIEDPVGEVRKVYEHLGLNDFAAVEPRLAAHVETQKNYRRNVYELDASRKAEIYSRWRTYFDTYGYEA